MCWVGRFTGYKLVLGAWPNVDIENARCVVMWGANPPHSRPNLTQRITTARRRGATLVVVDPRLSAVARRADLHVAPLPGTDGALALGLIRELVETGAVRPRLRRAATLGFATSPPTPGTSPPTCVERETGVPAARVRRDGATAARRRRAWRSTPGNGLEHHENGVDNIRAIVSLNALLGTLGKVGGSLFAPPLPLRDLTLYDERPLTDLEPLGADRFPVLYEVRRECHTMTALNAILTGEPYRLRAMLLAGGNPALTNPNSRKVVQALSALELLVVRDLFLTETAALADYVLPAASFLERSEVHTHHEIGVVTLTTSVGRRPEVQTEYEFWRDLARRLGAAEYFPWEDDRELNRWLLGAHRHLAGGARGASRGG